MYYGEYAYVSNNPESQGALYFNLDEVPVPSGEESSAEAKEKLVTLVRHGFGIQLYGRNSEAGDRLCYYAGKWDRDQKNGDGSVMIFPDGVSTFTGSFRANQFHGQGTLNLKT